MDMYTAERDNTTIRYFEFLKTPLFLLDVGWTCPQTSLGEENIRILFSVGAHDTCVLFLAVQQCIYVLSLT